MIRWIALVAATLLSGCATNCGDDPDPLVRCGYASDTGAAFLGFHGPVHRLPEPASSEPLFAVPASEDSEFAAHR